MQLRLGTSLEHLESDPEKVGTPGLFSFMRKETSQIREVPNKLPLGEVRSEEGKVIRVIGNLDSGRSVYISNLVHQALLQDASILFIDTISSNDIVWQLVSKGCLLDMAALTKKTDNCYIITDKFCDNEIDHAISSPGITYFAMSHDLYFSPEGKDNVANIIADLSRFISNSPKKEHPLVVVFNGIYDYGKSSIEVKNSMDQLIKYAADKGVTIIISDMEVYVDRHIINDNFIPEKNDIIVFKKAGSYNTNFKINGVQLRQLSLGEGVFYSEQMGLVSGTVSFNEYKIPEYEISLDQHGKVIFHTEEN